MNYDDYTLNSKSLIKRFTHRTRYGVAVEHCLKNNPQTLLDYGTGSGHLLIELNQRNPDLDLYGFEPMSGMLTEARRNSNSIEKIKLFQSLEQIPKAFFDKVTCFEVFEHLDTKDTLIALENFKKFLKQDGEIIVSIPIETGFASLCKNFVRRMIGVPHDKNWKNVIKAFLNKKIERSFSGGYCGSHVGFRHSDLERSFRQAKLKIHSKKYSPIPRFKGVINSQIFYTLKMH